MMANVSTTDNNHHNIDVDDNNSLAQFRCSRQDLNHPSTQLNSARRVTNNHPLHNKLAASHIQNMALSFQCAICHENVDSALFSEHFIDSGQCCNANGPTTNQDKL